jgi:hypothetical protein
MTKTISTQLARELVYEETTIDGVTHVAIQDEGSGRWMSYHLLVVQFADEPGKFFGASFEQGLTESQDTYPFEDFGDEVRFEEVEPFEVTTTEYRAKG